MTETSERRSLGSIWLVLAAIASVQVGSSIAKHAFARVTPTGMLWLRLTGGAVVLGIVQLARRRRRRAETDRAPRDWRAGLFYALTMVGMNASFYQGLRRTPVGLAVTIEFLGPLTVGALGARRPREVAWPVLALVGVAMLGFTPSRPDLLGVLFCLGAGLFWGLYIPASARAGRTWEPVDALFMSCSVGSLATLVPALLTNGSALVAPGLLVVGLGVGTMSTALPYSLEMAALRTIPKGVFGILMSLEPAMAALFALVLLGEHLHPLDLVAMACVVAASIGAARTARTT